MSKENICSNKKEKLRETVLFLILVICIIMVNTYIGTIAFVSGNSMYPTLFDKDILIVKKYNYLANINDIVIINTKQKTHLKDSAIVKRVIALENQVVKIDYDSNTITVDGIQLNEEYINIEDNDPLKCNYDNSLKTYTVPKNSIFVLGDNRNYSLDSRTDYIGMVSMDDIVGRVVFIIRIGKFIEGFQSNFTM